MPNQSAPVNGKSRYSGWYYDGVNDVLEYYHKGTRVGQASGAVQTFDGAPVFGASGITVPTGNLIDTAGDIRVTAGNFRAGVVSTFGTTEPTSALVMKAGTAPVGAITTSGGIFASATVVRKIIADGTVTNVET